MILLHIPYISNSKNISAFYIWNISFVLQNKCKFTPIESKLRETWEQEKIKLHSQQIKIQSSNLKPLEKKEHLLLILFHYSCFICFYSVIKRKIIILWKCNPSQNRRSFLSTKSTATTSTKKRRSKSRKCYLFYY